MKTADVTALVLGGGVGKRFWPITTGKPLVSFFGKPMLAHVVESLRIAGFEKAVVVTNPVDEKTVRNIDVPGITLTVVVQKDPTGMADAALAARDAVGNQPCLILGADDFVSDDLYGGLVKQFQEGYALVVGKHVTNYMPGGYLSVKENTLVGIVEKPGEGNTPSDLLNLVFHFFPKPQEFFKVLAATKSTKDDVYEKALSAFAANHEVRVVGYNGPFYPMKYPWHILDVMGGLLSYCGSHKGKNVSIGKNVIIEGPVFIDDGVRIFEGTKIIGPCYIGPRTIIGNNNIIRASHIGADCVTGFNTDITRSYIGDNCWFHSNYVGDSVLMGNVSMGAGAVLANLRLDDGEISSFVKKEKIATGKNKLGAVIGTGVRIGVNASIMPGVKIGSDSFVGAGVVLEKDLPDESFCMMKPGYTVVKNARKAAASRDEFKGKL